MGFGVVALSINNILLLKLILKAVQNRNHFVTKQSQTTRFNFVSVVSRSAQC